MFTNDFHHFLAAFTDQRPQEPRWTHTSLAPRPPGPIEDRDGSGSIEGKELLKLLEVPGAGHRRPMAMAESISG